MSVVSMDSVRIPLTIAALNDLDVLPCNIQNAYLMADYRERLWVVAFPKFGSEDGKNLLVRHSLYRLKISGAEFRAFLVETLVAMGYQPSYTDPELWLWKAVNMDCFEYY